MKKKRILFLCKLNNSYGSHYGKLSGLFNSATFVAQALSDVHETKVVRVVDANCIDKEVFDFKPDLVVLEAVWVTPDKLRELVSIPRYKDIKWLVRVHSKPTFLANEGVAMKWLTEYLDIPNVIISGNNKDFNSMIRAIGGHSVYLPNIYLYEPKKTDFDEDKSYIDIGCFGAIRPMKNHLQQAVAAIIFANRIGLKLRFHINGTRCEQQGDNVLKNLRALFKETHHELIEHGWLKHEDFLTLVGTMDLGLQVSLSESFNIVSADFVSQNIPIVTSDEVEFISSLYYADSGDIWSVVEALEFAYYVRQFDFQKINQKHLDKHNRSAKRKWLNFLDGN